MVSEAEGGTVTIRVNGRALPARLYRKDHAQLAPGVVVDYPHLDGVFAWIAAQQQERDAARLANPKISRREKQRSARALPREPRRSHRSKRTSVLCREADTSTLC